MVIKQIGYVLLAIHLILWVWAAGGMIEWLLPAVPWKPYSNPEFPHTLLFFHWISVLIASSGFLYGFFTRWKFTPAFMILGYGLMTVICIIETFGYMTNPGKYIAMGFEITAYVVILLILHSAGFRQQYFS